jgi:hypothetical protein
MTREELISHLTDEHHKSPVTVAIRANPHVMFSTGRDLATYHQGIHDRRQEELDHDH